jgi:hypothetical protein
MHASPEEFESHNSRNRNWNGRAATATTATANAGEFPKCTLERLIFGA